MDVFNIGIYEKAMPEDISWEKRFKAAKEAGYNFLEISIDETEKRQKRLYWEAEKILELKKTAVHSGMNIHTMCLSIQRKFPLGSIEKDKEKQAMEIMRKAIDFASVMGISIIQIAGYDVYYEPSSEKTRKQFLYNLKKSVEAASMKGIILALETMENEFMNTVEKAMKYVHMVDSPYLKVYPDIGNVSNATQDIRGDIRKGKGSIVAAHLKETKPGIFREVPYGTGNVDFIAAIRQLKKQGVNMYLAEFWDNGTGNWEKRIRDVHNYLENKGRIALQTMTDRR